MSDAKKWFLGLDIGSNSVGFSATDTEYNILTKSGKLQCGARLFEDAQDASTRRISRATRRRFARRKVRIDLLQELFNDEIVGIDPAFFIRLNESNLHSEDKTEKMQYPLFNDSGFTDKEYYKKYPTIYHLRKHLIYNDEKDARLLYLVCHHLVKYRGNFLSNTFNTERPDDGYSEIIDKINAYLQDNCDTFGEFQVVLEDKKNVKCDNKNILEAMKGNKIKLENIFENLGDTVREHKETLKEFKFSSEKFEECLQTAQEILNDEQLGFILTLKEYYDLKKLDDVMQGAKFVCDAMVNRFEEHKKDSRLLKNFFKTHLPTEYDKMFRYNKTKKDDDNFASYSNYIGSNLTHSKKTKSHHKITFNKNDDEPMTATHEDFIKYTMTLLETVSDNIKNTEDYKELYKKCTEKSLCKIHNTRDNAYIPYQLNEYELKNILERQQNNYPFLQKSDEFGTVADKIIKILTFRIPYYVGPLNEKHKGKFAWVEKQSGYEGQKVLPWNFDKIVDTANSGENFITKMTAKCTYLRAEDVLPKQSLLYQKYLLLNDLNNLKINENRILQQIKMKLFEGLCKTETNLSKNKIKDWLLKQGLIPKDCKVGNENENDAAFNSSLSSLIKFEDILGENIDEEMCENIIKWHTVFGDEKQPVHDKIRAFYGNKLTEDQISKLVKLSFKGWGRLSKKFLTGLTTTDKTTGETALTIIKLLENTTHNLIEILNNDNYQPIFLDKVKTENVPENVIFSYDDLVKDLYCSPIVKRSIWQALLISKELEKINGSAPEKVFIEVTRTDDKSKKGKMPQSRRKQLDQLLNNVAKDGTDIKKLKEQFDKKTDEKEFRSDRLYLYFTQLGKCMYSGEPINIEDVSNENLYDIDHIYPQSKIKDDSLTNKVLVRKDENLKKSNRYPICSGIQSKMKSYWETLNKKKVDSGRKVKKIDLHRRARR